MFPSRGSSSQTPDGQCGCSVPTHQNQPQTSRCRVSCNVPQDQWLETMNQLRHAEAKLHVLEIRRKINEIVSLIINRPTDSGNRSVELTEEIAHHQEQLVERLLVNEIECVCDPAVHACPVLGANRLRRSVSASYVRPETSMNQFDPEGAWQPRPFSAPAGFPVGDNQVREFPGVFWNYVPEVPPSFTPTPPPMVMSYPPPPPPMPMSYPPPPPPMPMSYPPPPPAMPMSFPPPSRPMPIVARPHVQGMMRAWTLRGPPWLANYVKFDLIPETVGLDQPPTMAGCFIRLIEITPQMQEGPTCGLLALSLIANLFQPTSVVEDVLPLAIRLGVSGIGEVFSADGMARLAGHLLRPYCRVTLLSENPLLHRVHELFEKLEKGHAVFLVPYDNDNNNSPGLHSGRKAHWCVVVGCARFRGDLYYCIAQGRTRKLGIFRHEILAASNNQLYVPKPDLPMHLMRIGSMTNELRGQIVVVEFLPGTTLRVAYCTDRDTMTSYFEHITRPRK